MHFDGYHGVAEFTVIANNNNNYSLCETKSCHTILVPVDSLNEVKNVRRDEQQRIIPGERLSLYCKWEQKRWKVYALRPGQYTPLVENQETEFKTQGLWSLEEDVCSMANGVGGVIYWGLDDGGNVVGIKSLLEKYGNQDKLTGYLRNRVKQNTNSLLFMNLKFEFITRKGLPILKITVPVSKEIVLFKDALYVRSDNTSQHLTGDNMLSFIYQRMKELYEK